MAGLMALFALGSAINATIGVFLSYYIEEYGLVAAEQGACGSAQSLGFLLSVVASAFLLKKLEKPKVVLLMAGIMAIVLPGLGMKPPFVLLLALYAIFGLSYGAVDSLSSSLLSDVYPGHSAEKIGKLKAVYCLGGVLAPLIFQAVLRTGVKWNRILSVSGFVGIAVFFYFAFVSMPRLPQREAKNEKAESMDLSDFAEFFRAKGVVAALIFAMIYNGHMSGQTVWIIRYISEYMGEKAWAGYSLSLFWIGAFAARMIFPQRMKSHRRLLLTGTLASFALYMAGIASGNGKLMCLMMLPIGIAEGAVIPVIVDYACSLKREKSAVACASVMLATNIGSVIFSALIGQVISVRGATTGILLLPASALICGMIAAIFRKEEGR